MTVAAKRVKAWKSKIVPGKAYPINEALGLVKEFAGAKFDESVDVAVNLGIDASKSDQQVRGSTVMPHGIGKSVRVAFPDRWLAAHPLTKAELEEEAAYLDEAGLRLVVD